MEGVHDKSQATGTTGEQSLRLSAMPIMQLSILHNEHLADQLVYAYLVTRDFCVIYTVIADLNLPICMCTTAEHCLTDVAGKCHLPTLDSAHNI